MLMKIHSILGHTLALAWLHSSTVGFIISGESENASLCKKMFVDTIICTDNVFEGPEGSGPSMK